MEKTIRYLLSFVGTDGSVLMSVWIFKGKPAADQEENAMLQVDFNIEDDERALSGTWKRYYAFTATGYSNKDMHGQIMAKIGKIWK